MRRHGDATLPDPLSVEQPGIREGDGKLKLAFLDPEILVIFVVTTPHRLQMLPLSADYTEEQPQRAAAFAKRFSLVEWRFLCSFQWFLKGVAQGLESGDFSHLGVRAELTLTTCHLRQSASDEELALCHSTAWYK